MKKKYVLLLLCSFLGLAALTAQVRVGAKGGINMPKVNSSLGGSNTGFSSMIGLDAAVFVEIPFSETLSIQPMVQYAQQGARRKGLQAVGIPSEFKELPPFRDRDHVFVDITTEINLDYLFFPVLFKAGWDFEMNNGITGNHYRFYVGIGPNIGYLMNSKVSLKDTFTGLYASKNGKDNLLGEGREVDVSSYQGIHPDLEGEYAFRKTNVGLTGSAGIGYYFQGNAIFLEIGGNYGFQSLLKNNEDTTRPGAVGLSLGYSRRL